MRTEPRTMILRILGLTFLGLIILFGINRFSKYINGPEITAINLENNSYNKQGFHILKADIKNTDTISLNKRDLIINEGTSIEEIIVFSPGRNIIEIELIDPFGKKKKYTYTVFGDMPETDTPKNLAEAQKAQSEKEEILKETLNETIKE